MKTKFYVVFDASGAQRLTKKHTPSMYRHEVAVGFTVNMPNSVFKSPVINATVDVPEDRIIMPEAIEVEVEADTSGEGGQS